MPTVVRELSCLKKWRCLLLLCGLCHIHVHRMTVKVSNVSLGASKQGIKESFCLSCDVKYVEMKSYKIITVIAKLYIGLEALAWKHAVGPTFMLSWCSVLRHWFEASFACLYTSAFGIMSEAFMFLYHKIYNCYWQ